MYKISPICILLNRKAYIAPCENFILEVKRRRGKMTQVVALVDYVKKRGEEGWR
jgi:hypothetical protein